MKKYAVILFILLSLFLLGCEKEREVRTVSEPSDFLIVTQDGGIEEQTAKMVGVALEDMGYSYFLKKEMPRALPEGTLGVVFVGADSEATDLPFVRCSFRMNDSAENTLSPSISSGTMARAATLLLPSAQHFTVLSREAGGADVQDACDFFDLCGVDYRARTLEVGEVAAVLSESGSDAVLLPSIELSGRGIELFSEGCAVFAVGEGEAVRGALATFCIDTERLARDTATLAVSAITGEESPLHTESYYILCLDRTLCEKYNADVPAVDEDFKVVLVD